MLSKELLIELDNYINRRLEISIEENMQYSEIQYMTSYKHVSHDKLDDYINDNKEQTFTEYLFKIIDERKLKDSDVYKKAGIDRKLFSKIRSNNDYHPSKRTSIALGLALELDSEDMDYLLNKNGYSLSKNDKFDLIIRFFINNKIFDLFEVNEGLERHSLKPFSVYL